MSIFKLRGGFQVVGVHLDVLHLDGNEMVVTASHSDGLGTIRHARHELVRGTRHDEAAANAVVVGNQDDHPGLLGQTDVGRRIGADRNLGAGSDSGQTPAVGAATDSTAVGRIADHGMPSAHVGRQNHQGHQVDRQTLVDRQDLDDDPQTQEARRDDLPELLSRLDVLWIASVLPEAS